MVNSADYVVDANGCWVWQRAKTGNGYGEMRDGPWKQKYAHRVFYERVRGPIPAGFYIDHLCRNHACVNPDHLEPVLPRTNAHRGIKTRINADIAAEIRFAVAGGARTENVAQKYCVSQTHVRQICWGVRWASAGGPILKHLPVRGRRRATENVE